MLSLAMARKDYYPRKVGEISHRENYYLRGGSATGHWHGEVSAPSDTPKQQTVELPEKTPPDRPAMTGRVRRRQHQGSDQLDLFDSRPIDG